MAGLRERKKAQTRQHIADTAARLFAAHGYDEVAIADVARAAEVSDQTVYNYFPTKLDLALDRADEIREQLSSAVLDRPAGTTPAEALRGIARRALGVHRRSELDHARGELPALAAGSPAIRRAVLETFDRQVEAVAEAITGSDPTVHPAVARARAAGLLWIFQHIADRVGRGVLDGRPPAVVADELAPEVEAVFDDLDRPFRSIQEDPR
ncbi:TetR/AcrR family transcriptional regulator [Actinomycetospora sp. NBRC 106375]|uniref:TetR/AcrR family transcriptional regulator n=1 Tax=Actinomycetospora sp. NBRC 106375 TaxID=3032207 RepID=UPI00255306A5|nr:TetR/AcrR family transcriptional regulator [Actinomycetospora sp. NBRC 106375]